MLVLARKIGQSIKIGDDIEIMVTQVGKTRAKLGITAPKHVLVCSEVPKEEDDDEV